MPSLQQALQLSQAASTRHCQENQGAALHEHTHGPTHPCSATTQTPLHYDNTQDTATASLLLAVAFQRQQKSLQTRPLAGSSQTHMPPWPLLRFLTLTCSGWADTAHMQHIRAPQRVKGVLQEMLMATSSAVDSSHSTCQCTQAPNSMSVGLDWSSRQQAVTARKYFQQKRAKQTAEGPHPELPGEKQACTCSAHPHAS